MRHGRIDYEVAGGWSLPRNGGGSSTKTGDVGDGIQRRGVQMAMLSREGGGGAVHLG
jgi:hypothetical protein